MRKNVLLGVLAAGVLLSGCSGYYQKETGKTGPEIETVEHTEAASQGPAHAETGAAIDPLELPEEETPALSPEIIIASDIHYLAKELTDFGSGFEAYVENGDGKMTTYVWEITDAFLDEVIDRSPQALILSGDLSLEGELLSHEALADQLRRVEDAGIPVVVITAKHDHNNYNAAVYRGSQTEPAEPTSPRQFADIYGNYGYLEAVSRDPASLSYVYELENGTWLLMLDSCQYEENSKVGGMIRRDTYSWMETVLEQAWEEEHPVIAVAHHNLLDQSRIYEEDCTIEHGEELEEMLWEWGVSLFLSGHLHVQHYRTSPDYGIDEIVTGSVSVSPFLYGVLTMTDAATYDYETRQLDVSEWASRHHNPDLNLQDFSTYADGVLQQIFYRKALDSLKDEAVTEEEKIHMAEVYAILNVYAVAGRAVEIRDMAEAMPGYEQWQSINRTNIRSMYLNEILEDAVVNYNVLSRP